MVEHPGKARPQGAAVLAARILRRGGARHRIGGAGARDLRAAGLCPPRNRAQPLRGREPARQGRDFRRGTRRGSRYRRAGNLFGAWRAAQRSRGGGAAPSVRARRHLSAGDQGASRGRDPLPPRPRDRADRPCRPPGGHRHHGPVAAGRGHADRDRGRRRKFHPARRRQSRLRDADHAVGAGHRGDRRRAQARAFRASPGRTRTTSATPPPTARKRSSAWRRWSTP